MKYLAEEKVSNSRPKNPLHGLFEKTMETGSFHMGRPRTLEMHRVPKFRYEKTLLELASADEDYYRQTKATGTDRTHSDVAEFLPFAAEKYHISPYLSDYVITAMPIVPSDLPNRNLVAFPFSVLTDFSVAQKMMQYKSWKAVPTHYEHDNKDPTKAKGIVLDVSLAPMKTAVDPVWKVMALCAFDRTKDSALANKILTGEYDEYSMGAWVDGYSCSVCGNQTHSPREPNCAHVHPKRQRLNVHEVAGRPMLAYWNVNAFQGFEISSVGDGAFKGAKSQHLLNKQLPE